MAKYAIFVAPPSLSQPQSSKERVTVSTSYLCRRGICTPIRRDIKTAEVITLPAMWCSPRPGYMQMLFWQPPPTLTLSQRHSWTVAGHPHPPTIAQCKNWQARFSGHPKYPQLIPPEVLCLCKGNSVLFLPHEVSLWFSPDASIWWLRHGCFFCNF